jgi:hypothetical protein
MHLYINQKLRLNITEGTNVHGENLNVPFNMQTLMNCRKNNNKLDDWKGSYNVHLRDNRRSTITTGYVPAKSHVLMNLQRA